MWKFDTQHPDKFGHFSGNSFGEDLPDQYFFRLLRPQSLWHLRQVLGAVAATRPGEILTAIRQGDDAVSATEGWYWFKGATLKNTFKYHVSPTEISLLCRETKKICTLQHPYLSVSKWTCVSLIHTVFVLCQTEAKPRVTNTRCGENCAGHFPKMWRSV